MRYAQIRKRDISNGEGIGIALFVQGCNLHCKNCFNPETWDFDGGIEWDVQCAERIIDLADRPYIKRISILGGEPLHSNNIEEISKLIYKLRVCYQNNKKIWLYTGNVLNEDLTISNNDDPLLTYIIHNVDFIVDGPYVDELKDLTLKYRGSSNQRIIDVQQSLVNERVVLYE